MHVLDAEAGAVLSAITTPYPCALEVIGGEHVREGAACTTYGYVIEGPARVEAVGMRCELDEGAVFAVPGRLIVTTSGRVVLITRIGFLGIVTVSAIESRGRLSYIDGCSDSILVSPPRRGDPVLNHLHFPAGVRQTLHRHPSVRLGVVARGAGAAFGPGWERGLSRGQVFLIDAMEAHAFRTEVSSMDVVAFHPEGDWGPTDEVHPMRNRTTLV